MKKVVDKKKKKKEWPAHAHMMSCRESEHEEEAHLHEMKRNSF